MPETRTVRGPDEIQELFEKIKAKKKDQGKKYTALDFLDDVGYKRSYTTFSMITADPEKNHHRRIGRAKDMLMDHLEAQL